MTAQRLPDETARARQAVAVWIVFIVLTIIINGTIPFALGVDLRAWTYSTAKAILSPLLIYGGVFLVVPLILTKGRDTVRQPAFFLPLLAAVVAVALWSVYRGIGALALVALAYLHRRFDLSELGLRSRGWQGDLVAIVLPGALVFVISLLAGGSISGDPVSALLAGLGRLLANPASSVENLFYFGFMAERLSAKAGRWFTPLLIAAMYTAHEMLNPEYWYEGLSFGFVFAGVALLTVLYLWRRSVVVIWLGDGVRWFLAALI